MPLFERRLRIAVLTRHFGRHKGGAENYAVSLATQLALEHEVHVFCQSEFNDDPNIQTHVMGFRLTKPRWMNMLIYSAWTFFHTRRGFDIVHSHENVFHGNVQTFHVKPVTHNVFHAKHGVWLGLAWFKILLSPRLLSYLAVERARVRHPDKRLLITASELLKDLYAQTFKLAASQLHVLTPGVSMPTTPLRAHDDLSLKAQARQGLGLPNDKQILLMVGHNYEKKGLGALLLALTHLGTDNALAVVGDAGQIPFWQEKATSLGLSDRVFFLGPQTQMDQVYLAADLFVHATLEDVFPIVVLEAMSRGLPVVVSPAPYCLSSNLLNHLKEAWVLKDPRDDHEIAEAIAHIASNPDTKSTLLNHAQQFVKAYRWDSLVKTQTQLYLALLDSAP